MNLDIETLRRLIREELLPLAESMRPSGEFELDGYDPDYSTSAARETKLLPMGESHPDMEAPVNPHETVPFTFSVNLSSLDSDERVGVTIKAPSPQDGSCFEINGRQFTDFNSPVGRFGPGILSISGILYNGSSGGLLGIAFDGPADAEESDPFEFETREGTETIDLSAGFWFVTWMITQMADIPLPIDVVPYQVAEVELASHSEAWLLPFGEEAEEE